MAVDPKTQQLHDLREKARLDGGEKRVERQPAKSTL